MNMDKIPFYRAGTGGAGSTVKVPIPQRIGMVFKIKYWEIELQTTLQNNGDYVIAVICQKDYGSSEKFLDDGFVIDKMKVECLIVGAAYYHLEDLIKRKYVSHEVEEEDLYVFIKETTGDNIRGRLVGDWVPRSTKSKLKNRKGN